MSLVINAPGVEDKLKKVAAKKGISPAEYAVEILSDHLGAEGVGKDSRAKPFYATVTAEQWIAEFDRWVQSHPKRKPLPGHAFDRASFYEGRP